MASRFTANLDFSTQGQRAASAAKAAEQFTTSDTPAPDALPLEDLPQRIQDAVEAAGWDSLMPVQSRSIPIMLEERDLIVQSRTGSGKTGAFLLPLFDLLDPDGPGAQALIMSPTRELARQIAAEFEKMAGGSGLRHALVYGGVKYGPQNDALRGGAHVVIGTPGRILDHLERRTFRLDGLRALILDEADEMLSMGFYPAMRRLKGYLPSKRLSYMFSATMPAKVRNLAAEFLDSPEFLALSEGNQSVDAIDHRYYVVDGMMGKDRILVRLIEMENPDSAFIFANTKREVEYVSTFLRNFGYDADALSGDLSQKAREQVLAKIRRDDLRFLVCTDVAARGLDIDDLSHVFLYDVPVDTEAYIHRSGRTARAGKSGTAISFVTPKDKPTLHKIARNFGFEIEQHEIPTDEAVAQRVGERLTVTLEDRIRDKSNLEQERIQRFVPLVRDLAQEEPELLAGLLDELYQAQLRERQQGPEARDDEPRDESHHHEDRDDDERDDRRRGRGRRDGGRGRRRG